MAPSAPSERYARFPFKFLTAIVLLTVFLALAIAVHYRLTTDFDDLVRNWVHQHSSGGGARVMLRVSLLGSGDALAPVVLPMIALLLLRGYRRDALLLAVVMAGEVILENGLKESFHRSRPEPFFGLATPASYAFPSGHALASCCFYGAVALMFCSHVDSRRLRMTAWVLAILLIVAIGLSRIYLGVHYPTDVIGGYIVAAAWVIVASRLANQRLPAAHEAR